MAIKKPAAAKAVRPHIVIGPAISQLIELAEAGDFHALAGLYSITGALLAVDGAVPEPLLSFMQRRLASIAAFLNTDHRRDFRAGALPAMAIVPRRGPKKRGQGLLSHTTREALVAAEVWLRRGESDPIAAVAEKYSMDDSSVRKAVKRVNLLEP